MSFDLTIFPNHEEITPSPTYASYAKDLLSLFTTIPYLDALEIGLENGVSAIAMLTSNPKCHVTSIDVRPGDVIKGPRHIEQLGLTPRHTFINTTSRKFWNDNKRTYDLIYIDGDHTYEGALYDYLEAAVAIRDGGYIVLDDVDHWANLKGDYGCAYASIQLLKHIYPSKAYMHGRLMVIKYEG